MQSRTPSLIASILPLGMILVMSASVVQAQDLEDDARQKAANCDLDYDVLKENIARHLGGHGPGVDGEDSWKDYEFPLTIRKNNQECFTYLPRNPKYPGRSYERDQTTPMWSATKSLGALATGMVMYRVDTYIDALLAEDAANPSYKMRAIDTNTYEIKGAGYAKTLHRFTLDQTLFDWLAWSGADRFFEINQKVHRGASVRQILSMVAGKKPGEPEVQKPEALQVKFQYDVSGQRGLNQVGWMTNLVLKQFDDDRLPVPRGVEAIERSLDDFWVQQIKPSLGLAADSRWGIGQGQEGVEEFWQTYIADFAPLLLRAPLRMQADRLPKVSGALSLKASYGAVDELRKFLGIVPVFLPDVVKENLSRKLSGLKLYGFSWEASLDDMAKIGQVIVDQGIAQKGSPAEKRMVSEAFIYAMTHANYPTANSAMGLSLWVNSSAKNQQTLAWTDDRTEKDRMAPFTSHNSLVSCAPVDQNREGLAQGKLDTGVWMVAGAFGQVVMGHPGLGLVLAYKDATMEATRVSALAWQKIVAPALLVNRYGFDTVEDFCAAYDSNAFAPYQYP